MGLKAVKSENKENNWEIITVVQANDNGILEYVMEILKYILKMMPMKLDNKLNVDGKRKGWLKHDVQNMGLHN